jgi:hypothetical protein
MTAKSLADQAAEILPAEASERLEEAREGIESLDQRVRQTVAHHPLLCIGGAVLVGYFVGRVIARRT